MKGLRTVVIAIALLFGQLFGAIPRCAPIYYTRDEIVSFTEAAKDACGKGMVIAIGGGFDYEDTFQPLIDRCIAHTGKEHPNMLYIPTAHYDDPNDSLEQMIWFGNSGCQTDVLFVSRSTEQEVRDKIAWADIIYETGGDLNYLMDQWNEKGVTDAVKQAFDRGAALIGVSSGAMCWAERGWDNFGEEVERPIGTFPFYGVAGAYEFKDCTGILPFCVSPHYDNFGWRMFALEAMKLDIPSIGIENGAAVVFENGCYDIISDVKTPLRTAFLFDPARGLRLIDIRTNGKLAVLADGDGRVNRGA